MSKQLLMDLEEYNKDIEARFSQGFTQGRTQMVQVVTKILRGMGNEITLAENAEPELKACVDLLKKAAESLPEGALDEQTDGEADSSDQELQDEESHSDNV